MRTIHLASDHAGFALKGLLARHLESRGYAVQDHGTHSTESCDYPVLAHALAAAVEAEPEGLGVLICGTGIGVSITANRHPGIRAALCATELHKDTDNVSRISLINDTSGLCHNLLRLQ